MLPGEQLALVYFLQNLRPQVAIEIGTQLGRSLQIISHFSKKVDSLDINPEVPNRLARKYSNTEYIVGNSSTTLPLLLEKLEQETAEVSFILVDGDHSMEGLKRDLRAILKFKPCAHLYVLMY